MDCCGGRILKPKPSHPICERSSLALMAGTFTFGFIGVSLVLVAGFILMKDGPASSLGFTKTAVPGAVFIVLSAMCAKRSTP